MQADRNQVVANQLGAEVKELKAGTEPAAEQRQQLADDVGKLQQVQRGIRVEVATQLRKASDMADTQQRLEGTVAKHKAEAVAQAQEVCGFGSDAGSVCRALTRIASVCTRVCITS